MPKLNKAELLRQIEDLEVKADHYSRTDWVRYEQCQKELAKLNDQLLDCLTSENESFLQTGGNT